MDSREGAIVTLIKAIEKIQVLHLQQGGKHRGCLQCQDIKDAQNGLLEVNYLLGTQWLARLESQDEENR